MWFGAKPEIFDICRQIIGNPNLVIFPHSMKRKIGVDEELTAPKNAMMTDDVKMTLSIKSFSSSQ